MTNLKTGMMQEFTSLNLLSLTYLVAKDFTKLVGNASQHMYADPTRRFMVGTTIEDTNTWFRFFSRAIVLMSESFNFIEVRLIHLSKRFSLIVSRTTPI